ncbi:MAG: phosphate acyltransferase PlsX, partial [Egibacteraceae bacterium]
MADAPPARVRVALDAMGGDHAPAVTVAGALLAHAAGVDVVLVGQPDRLRAVMAGEGAPGLLPVVPAAEVVGMGEDPALALRTKRDASIRVAARLVAEGRAEALVSAGSTGATLAAALLLLGRLPGVRRPVIGALIPTKHGRVVLVDAGGSAAAQPEALVGYARMGAAYAGVLGVDAPRVGLLNVGVEPGKGNALAKAAHELLGGVPSFVGNVEPAGALDGSVDVVVTDGFTGNIFLKAVEAASGGYGDRAAIVLGVAGEVLVAHGAAGAEEVAEAVRMAAEAAAAGVSGKMAAQLARGLGGAPRSDRGLGGAPRSDRGLGGA